MATSTEMSLLRSSAALVNPSQRKRLMSCLKMETRTMMACWTLMVWWFINYISFYLWACMNSDQVLKQHPCPFSSRIPQDDGERAVKQRLKDIPLPSHPCQQEPLPLSATQIHFPLLSSFCLHLTSSADRQINTSVGFAKVGLPLNLHARSKEPSCGVVHRLIMLWWHSNSLEAHAMVDPAFVGV